MRKFVVFEIIYYMITALCIKNKLIQDKQLCKLMVFKEKLVYTSLKYQYRIKNNKLC